MSSEVMALSATTIQVINGTAPYLVGENGTIPADLNDALNFSVTNDKGEKTIYYGNSVLPKGTLTTGFKENMKISDFKIMDAGNFSDDDGDEGITVTGYTYSWKDRFGQEVNSNELLEPCRSPYQLEIKANDLELTTQYGIPRTKKYENIALSKTFAIEAQYHTPICYVQPLELWSMKENQWGGGWTADFIPDVGFKAQVIEAQGRVWPTTAFPGAVFSLLTRDIDKTNDHYTFSVIKGGDVLSVSNGNRFEFRRSLYDDYELQNRIKPPYQYTIEVRSKETNEVYEYSFEIEKWAVPDIHQRRWSFSSVKRNCGNVGATLFDPGELTNSPLNAWDKARIKRAIDGTIQGEWGPLPKYTDSFWLLRPHGKKYDGYYWVSDGSQVFADHGSRRNTGTNYFQVCKVMAK